MSKDIIYFAENICGVKLSDWQKDLLRQKQEANDKGELILVNLGRQQGRQLVNNILINFQIWSKNQQIADLEAKLSESEEYNQMLLEEKGGYIDLVSGYSKKCKNYEQQLAEKDKELLEIKQRIAEKASKEFQEMIDKRENHNQDKISFCIERLEKVKEFFLEEHRDEEMDTDYIITKDACQIAEYLLDQIKQLKEMKYR